MLIKDNAILEEKTGIWCLPNVSGPGKKLKANYSSLATVFAIKENCIALQIVKSKIFKLKTVILVKEEVLKIPTKEQVSSIISS